MKKLIFIISFILISNIGYTNQKGLSYGKDLSLPVKDVDQSNRESLNTVFGEKITGIRRPSTAAQFQYPLESNYATISTVNSGTVSQVDSLLVVSTGTSANVTASIQSRDFLRYIPGHEAYINFTATFSEGKANSTQRAGLFDTEDGFYIGYEGTDFCVSRRRDSVDYRSTINILNVFNDKTYNPSKGNIYRISFGYLGFAAIHFEVMNSYGGWEELHVIQYPNTQITTHISQTNLPARAEVANNGNTSDIVFKSGSFEFGIVDGGGTDPSSRFQTFASSNITAVAGVDEIVTFRNKATYGGLDNRVSGRLLLISYGTDLNKNASFQILKNATITNTPNWIDVDTDDSIFEYSIDATVDETTGKVMLPWIAGKTDSMILDIPDSWRIKLRPEEHATIITTTPAGTTGTIDLSMRWVEEF